MADYTKFEGAVVSYLREGKSDLSNAGRCSQVGFFGAQKSEAFRQCNSSAYLEALGFDASKIPEFTN